jgi:segregation and condensation protein B
MGLCGNDWVSGVEQVGTLNDKNRVAKMAPPRLTLVPNSPRPADLSEEEIEALAAAESSASEPVAGRASPSLAPAGRHDQLRILEAVLFAAATPLDEKTLASHLPSGSAPISELIEELRGYYRGRGINLVRVAGKWSFRTAEDLSYLLEKYTKEARKLSKAALETLAIIAYHQPVTRAEIEEIRGVSISPGTLDILMETGWVRPRGRRRAPGKPITYGTTEEFLSHFGLDTIKDLPGLAELKGAGLLEGNLPPGFTVPEPTDVAALMPDELPLDAVDHEEEAVQGEMSLDLPHAEEADKSGDLE